MRTAKSLPPCFGSLLPLVGLRRLARALLGVRRAGTLTRERPEIRQLALAHALHDLGLQLFLLVLLDRLLGALDQRQHVAHPEDARGHPVGVEVLELVELLP